jgi:hypothetical protein
MDKKPRLGSETLEWIRDHPKAREELSLSGGIHMKPLFLLFLSLVFACSAFGESTLALQEKCSKGANELFYEGHASTMTQSETLGNCFNSYESHYNKKMDKCFILDRSTCVNKGVSSLFISLWDVCEHKQYAGYTSFRDLEGFLTARFCNLGEDRLDGVGEVLKVHGKYQDPVKQKFDNWVKPYMED